MNLILSGSAKQTLTYLEFLHEPSGEARAVPRARLTRCGLVAGSWLRKRLREPQADIGVHIDLIALSLEYPCIT